MANMVSYKRVSGDIAEAKKIHALLQEDLTKQLPELAKDMRLLTAASALVAKWDMIVTDLETDADATTEQSRNQKPAFGTQANPAKVVADMITKQIDEGGDSKGGKPAPKKA